MKVLLCCIARLENNYIREFIAHYKNLGVDNICLYDNNFDGEEDFKEVIADYIERGYVFLHDFRNKRFAQFESYNHCYGMYKNSYDWIIFLDVDEFLFLRKHSDIKEFLSDDLYKDYQAIHVNRVLYSDNNLLYEDTRPVVERFTEISYGNDTDDPQSTKDNTPIKTILRGGLQHINYINPHAPHTFCGYKACRTDGVQCEFFSFFAKHVDDIAVINHYATKSVTEYVIKLKRGSATKPRPYEEYINKFFNINVPTKEKIDIILDSTGVDMSHLIKP